MSLLKGGWFSCTYKSVQQTHWPCAGIMLGQRLRRWPSIIPAQGRCVGVLGCCKGPDNDRRSQDRHQEQSPRSTPYPSCSSSCILLPSSWLCDTLLGATVSILVQFSKPDIGQAKGHVVIASSDRCGTWYFLQEEKRFNLDSKASPETAEYYFMTAYEQIWFRNQRVWNKLKIKTLILYFCSRDRGVQKN